MARTGHTLGVELCLPWDLAKCAFQPFQPFRLPASDLAKLGSPRPYPGLPEAPGDLPCMPPDRLQILGAGVAQNPQTCSFCQHLFSRFLLAPCPPSLQVGAELQSLTTSDRHSHCILCISAHKHLGISTLELGRSGRWPKRLDRRCPPSLTNRTQPRPTTNPSTQFSTSFLPFPEV